MAACGAENRSPQLVPVADQSVVVGLVLEVDVIASDPDGDRLRYEVEGLPGTATVTPGERGVRLRWAPIASEAEAGGRRYEVLVRALDGAGGWAELRFAVLAFPQGGLPAFLTPPGFVLDLSESDRISFLVVVKDDDSPEVSIDVLVDLPGAKWSVIDDRTRGITWSPTEDQVRQSSYWPLIVGATDESHPMVVHTISVVLANAGRPRDCEGTWPIEGEVRLEAEAGGIVVGGSFSDPESPVRRVVASWTGYGQDGSELGSGATSLAPGAQGFEARVSAPELGEGAVLAEVSLRVRDDDDRDSSLCDHELRLPRSGAWTVPVVPGVCPPDENGGAILRARAGDRLRLRVCPGASRRVEVPVGLDDVMSVTAFSPDGGKIRLALAGEDPSTVLQTAEGEGLVHLQRAPMGDPGPARVTVDRPGAQGPARVELLLATAEHPCAPDLTEPDDTPDQASTASSGMRETRLLCPADLDLLRLDLPLESVVEVTAAFEQMEGDLDLALTDLEGNVLRLAAARTDGERLRTSMGPGSYLLEVRPAGAQGPIAYELGVSVDTGSGCLEDFLSPNAAADTAPVIPELHLDDLVLCPGTADHFAHVVNDQESYAVLAEPAAGNSTLEVPLTTPPLASGLYVLRVSSPDQGPVRYAFGFQVETHRSGCPPDRFAPNDTPETAPLVGLGWSTRLLLCPDETDYFAVRTAGPGAVRLEVFYASSFEPVFVDQIGADGAILDTAEDHGYGALLDAVVPGAGEHIFRVTPTAAPTFYDLAVEVP
jgi:hypothetical protein